MKTFPKQRLSFAEKTKDDYQWVKDTIDCLVINYANERGSMNPGATDYDRMHSNYQLFNNQLNQKDFEKECDPLGIDAGQFKDEIMPYNKTYNKIQVLLSDEMRRPFNFRAVLTNSEGIKSKMAYKDSLLREYVYSQIQQVTSSLDQNFNPEISKQYGSVMDPEEIDKYMSTKYLDSVEITANKLLRHFSKALLVQEKKNDAYKHALLSGYEYAYIGESNGEPILDIPNPLGMFYHKSPETKYIQDGLFAGFRTYMTTGDVLDRFSEYLTEDDLTKIDMFRHGGFSDYNASYNNPMRHSDYYYGQFLENPRSEGSYGTTLSVDDWLVQHVEWKSQKKVGFLNFTNEYGDPEMDLVSEDFVVPENATKMTVIGDFGKKSKYDTWVDLDGNQFALSWGWVPEVWTGVRIADNIYCMMGPKKQQYRSIDNPFSVKLGYHGVVYSAMNAQPIAIMDRMKPFQYLYFIIMHKLKKLIAQDKGKIFHLDSTMLDPKLGWEKTLYYLTSMNLDIYNPLQNADQPGWSQRGKVTGSTDMSTAANIANYVQLLEAIDNQISDVAGVNRQREGQTVANEAVTNAQSNIQMSAVITEIYAQTHDNLWEQVLGSLIQTAQSCYKNKNVTKQFVLDDMSIETLNITPDTFLNSDLGVYVSNSQKENELFGALKNLSQALIQNDKAKYSDLIKLYKADSVEQLESQILESEKQAMQEQQAVAQQQQQAEAQAQQAAQQFQLLIQKNDLENKVLIAEIDSFKLQQEQDKDQDGVPDQFEVQKWQTEAALRVRDQDIKKKQVDNSIRQKDEEIAIKKKVANKPNKS